MEPQANPLKPYAVGRTETVYTYHDTLEEAEAEYDQYVNTDVAAPEVGVRTELWLWLYMHGVWYVSQSREIAPIPQTFEAS